MIWSLDLSRPNLFQPMMRKTLDILLIMQLVNFIKNESANSYRQIAIVILVSGIANCLLLIIINHVTQVLTSGENLKQFLVMYLISFGLFLYGQWFAFERGIRAMEEALYSIRIRLAQKTQLVELEFVERMGNNRLYARLTQNDTLISQATPQAIGAAQMSILLFFSIVYLAYISLISFLVSIVAIVIGVYIFFSQSKSIQHSLNIVKQQELIHHRSISHLVNGFKEIKINQRKGNDILDDIAEVSGEATRIKARVLQRESRIWGFGRVFIYILLPVLGTVALNIGVQNQAEVVRISTTLLFIIGPITIVVNVLPILNRVNMAISDLLDLESEMDKAIESRVHVRSAALPAFKNIRFKQVTFAYPNSSESFSSGPFDLEVRAGELLFIVGGNGSGKSTLLKLLAGLYYPEGGRICTDDKLIEKSEYSHFRNMFSVVFTDFHIFDKFYGISNIEEETVCYWLARMQIQHKVQYSNGGFTSTKLSTGQRKRLAFIAAMLENRPILVLDEFAADQDPQFRKHFYESVLPELVEAGKTIIAVTHDDHYFHVADRVITMHEGRICSSTESVEM